MANQSAEAANKTKVEFETMMRLIQEVIEVTTTQRGVEEHKLEKAANAINITQVKIDGLSEYKQELKRNAEKLEAEKGEALKEYKKALDGLPTAKQIFNQELKKIAISGAMSMLPGGFAGVLAANSKNTCSGNTTYQSQPSRTVVSQAEGQVEKNVIINNLDVYAKGWQQIEEILEGSSSRPEDNPSSKLAILIDQWNKGKEDYSQSKFAKVAILRTAATDWLESSVTLGEEMKDAFANVTSLPSNSTVSLYLRQLRELKAKAESLKNDAQSNGGGSEVNQITDAQKIAIDPCDKFAGPKLKARLTLQNLQDVRNLHARTVNDTMKIKREIVDLISKLSGLKLDRLNFQKIVDVLKEALGVLATLQKAWGNLVLFFSKIAIHTDVRLKENVKSYMDTSNALKEMADWLGVTANELSAPTANLIEAAQAIQKDAYFLETVSGTYTYISRKYIVIELAKLPQLLSMESDSERKQMLQEIKRRSERATEDINQVANSYNQKMKQVLNQRIAFVKESLANYTLQTDPAAIAGDAQSSQTDLTAADGYWVE